MTTYQTAPMRKLKTNRGLMKFILLNIITFGIYGIVFMTSFTNDLNTIASRYDGKKTTHYLLVLFLWSWLTAGIYPIIWQHNLSNRLGDEARRRGIATRFSASDFWLWGVIGSFIVVGPFIYSYRMIKTMNDIAADYNIRG